MLSKPLKFGDFNFQLYVRLDSFRDTDIADEEESKRAIRHYEWAITDGEETRGILDKWTTVIPLMQSENKVKPSLTFVMISLYF